MDRSKKIIPWHRYPHRATKAVSNVVGRSIRVRKDLLQLLKGTWMSFVHSVWYFLVGQRCGTKMNGDFPSPVRVGSVKIQNTAWSDELAGNVLHCLF